METFSHTDADIRIATPDDEQKIITLINSVCREGRFLQTTRFTPTPTWTNLLETCFDLEDRVALFVVACGKSIVGMGRLCQDRRSTAPRPIGNIGIVLAPEWRGKKIGTFLLAKLLKTAIIVGYHTLRADILSINQRSLRLFRTFSFQDIGVHDFFWPATNQWIDEATLERHLMPANSPKAGSINLDGGNASIAYNKKKSYDVEAH
ncbi:MAG: GNAT family N-acetyltransferase [bacterium]